MSYFARRLEYAAHDGEAGAHFLALLEIARKKGGRPDSFVLYRYIVQYNPKECYPSGKQYECRMIRLKTKIREVAKGFFPFAEKSKFPGHQSILWRPTTLWLYPVAVGGGYGQFPEGTWVKVGTPAPWKERRKKKPAVFGSIPYLIKREEARIKELKDETFQLGWRLNELESYDDEEGCNFVPEGNESAHQAILEEIEVLKEGIAGAETKILGFKDELRFAYAKKSRRPFFPRDGEGMIQKSRAFVPAL